MSKDNEERLLSFKETGRLLGASARTVRRMIDKQELPQPVRVGRSVRLFLSDVLAYLERLKQGRLTAFCFHVTKKEKTFFGTEREAKSRPYIYIPVSECKAWAKELEARFPTDDSAEKHRVIRATP